MAATKEQVLDILNSVCPVTDVDFDATLQRINSVTHGGTDLQQANLRAAIANFDFSDAAHLAWLESKSPQLATLINNAQQAITDLNIFLALSSPTNAQVLAIVQKLCQQNKIIIQRLVQLLELS